MKREILFRAKCFGNWRYGSYLHFEKKPINSRLNINYKDFIITNESDGEHYYPITDLSSIGQYTGLTDKNGKEIYEGDILRTGSTSNLTVEVVYNEEDTSFVLKLTSINEVSARSLGSWLSLGYECTIIGNVYDNPELMK